jgi:hypothetical protein
MKLIQLIETVENYSASLDKELEKIKTKELRRFNLDELFEFIKNNPDKSDEAILSKMKKSFGNKSLREHMYKTLPSLLDDLDGEIANMCLDLQSKLK